MSASTQCWFNVGPTLNQQWVNRAHTHGRFELHDGRVVVGKTKRVECISQNIEVPLVFFSDVFVYDRHVVVPVLALVLMSQGQGVQDLMCYLSHLRQKA